MGINSMTINNLLDVFVEAEEKRATGTLPQQQEKHLQFKNRCFVKRKNIDKLQNQFDIVGAPKISDRIRHLNLSPAEIFIFNSSLRELLEDMIVEMIRQGVIVLDIRDSRFGYDTIELTLTCMAANPKPSIKRIDIQK